MATKKLKHRKRKRRPSGAIDYEKMEQIYQGLLRVGRAHQEREIMVLIGTDPLIGKRRR
jgi:hypothetical protein